MIRAFPFAPGLRPPPVAEIAPAMDLKRIPPGATFLRILGVNYVHLKTADEGDLYLTEHGIPFLEHLKPENWYEDAWFKSKRERLAGTSVIYRVPTMPLEGRMPRSLDLVVKWSRVGEDVPIDTFTLNQTINAEFNTPFEEFNLLEELRNGSYWPAQHRILTQKPLAIYCPPERMQLWQTGRSKSKILTKIAKHPGIEIDILRSYILLYAWIDGINAVDAYKNSLLDDAGQKQAMADLTHRVNRELEENGFTVADNKPTHFILRTEQRPGPKRGQLKRTRDGQILYAMVDYELLARTPHHEDAVRKAMRSRYLLAQKDRFQPRQPATFPPHLRPARIMGVDYIYGRTESTNGALWVVGKNPELFNYFLPERWRTKQIQLSATNQTYYTHTKDRIHLVWKVSRVGDLPPGDLAEPGYEQLLRFGFNSPFEEFALALSLARAGIPAVYPRAIYMTGQEADLSGRVVDDQRFERYKHLLSPDGFPILRMDRDYITIWGYWRGLEDSEAHTEAGYWTPIDALAARSKGLVTTEAYDQIIKAHMARLAAAGFADLRAWGDHVLLSYIPENTLKKEADGSPQTRQCNFEMVARLGPDNQPLRSPQWET